MLLLLCVQEMSKGVDAGHAELVLQIDHGLRHFRHYSLVVFSYPMHFHLLLQAVQWNELEIIREKIFQLI